MISIHAPPRGATQACQRGIMRLVFQFTPLREGRQGLIAQLARLDISIHAPPRGATLFSAFSQLLPKISIHAPPRGATGIGEALWLANLYFNSRPSARGDDGKAGIPVGTVISIHAPPRGATTHTLPVSSSRRIFQFTPLREGRLVRAVDHRRRQSISIHAPPRGATRGVLLRRRLFPYFNSRPSARGDCFVSTLPFILLNFNSRPSARGDASSFPPPAY